MLLENSPGDAERRRDLERIVFSKGDPAAIERAARQLRLLESVLPASDAPALPRGGSVPPDVVDELEPPGTTARVHPRRRAALLACAALAILAGGMLIGSVVSTAGLADETATAIDDPTLAGGGSFASPSPGEGVAFVDINTGQVVGYGGGEPAAALEIFDREQLDPDRPRFPLAADLQPSTTRLLEQAGSASIFAALDTLARPCIVVVGPNQYSATCQTEFEFPKAGIRLSWAPSVDQGTTPSGGGRTSPVVYTVVWLPNGMVEVGALVQGG